MVRRAHVGRSTSRDEAGANHVPSAPPLRASPHPQLKRTLCLLSLRQCDKLAAWPLESDIDWSHDPDADKETFKWTRDAAAARKEVVSESTQYPLPSHARTGKLGTVMQLWRDCVRP